MTANGMHLTDVELASYQVRKWGQNGYAAAKSMSANDPTTVIAVKFAVMHKTGFN
jgi:hypothetical protein